MRRSACRPGSSPMRSPRQPSALAARHASQRSSEGNSMEAIDGTAHALPFRVIPRRRSQIGKIATSVVIIVACAIYMIAALQKLHAASAVYIPALDGQWPHWRPYVIGIPIILYAAWHIVRAVSKLLPGSPYYYLRIA